VVRRFFRDSAIYAIPAALSFGMSFFTFPLYAHHFTPREYGLLDLLTLAAMLVGWTVALEIYQAVGRFVSGEKDIMRAQSYASTALWFSAGAYTLFAVAAELFATPISHVMLGPGVRVSLLRVGVLYMCLGGFLAIPQAQLRWQLRPASFAIASVINAVFSVAASAVLVFAVHLGVEGAILGSLIGSCISLVYVLIATRGTFHLHFDVAKCKEMLAYSAPLVPSSVGVFLNLYADRLVIQHMRSLSDVGLYGVGYRLAMIASLLLIGVQGAALPLILARKDEPSTPADLARIFRLFTALALSAFVVLTILATPAIRILAAPEYQSASSVVPFLVIAVLFAGMYMFTVGISIGKKTGVMAILTVLAGLGNLTAALIFVPILGIAGAGIATASTSVAWFVALMAVSQRYYRVPHNWPQLISASVVVVALVGVSVVMLPQARSQALTPTTLGVRAVLVIVGVTLSARLALGRGSLGVALRSVSGAPAKIRVRARRGVVASEPGP
jgi:O-antigen/teichoic acid export membrane protein